MRFKKMLSASAVAGLVVLSMMFGVVAPAGAATAYPDGWSPKAFILHTRSSLMAAFGSEPAKRALIANSQKLDAGFETLEQQFKAEAAKGVPDTYVDHVMAQQEEFLQTHTTSKQGELAADGTQKKYVKAASFPATRSASLVKTVAGTAEKIFAGVVGVQLGAEADRALGVDVDGGFCSPDAAGDNWLAGMVGSDCDSWRMSGELASHANSDASGNATTGPVCVNGGCVTWTGEKFMDHASNPGESWCMATSGTISASSNAMVVIYLDGVSGPSSMLNWSRTWLLSSECVGVPYVRGPNKPADFLVPVPSGIMLMYGGGNSAVVATTLGDPDPQRTFRCDVKLTDGSTVSASTDPWRETDASIPPPVCPAVPSGKIAAGSEIFQTGPNGDVSVQPYTPTTPEYQEEGTLYPECALGACSSRLVDLRGAYPVDCFSSNEASMACNGWMDDPNKETDFKCTYGSHDVALKDCYAYGNVFDPQKIAAGQAYTDPATGLSVDGQSSPSAAKLAMSRPALAPSDMRGCLGSGWAAANPVEWVLVPIQCAMEWTFVPDPAVIHQAVDSMSSSWADTPFGQLGPVVQQFASVPVFDGCEGIPVDIQPDYPPGSTWGIHWKFGYSCDGALEPASHVVQGVSSGLVYAGGTLTLVNYISGALGYAGFGKKRS